MDAGLVVALVVGTIWIVGSKALKAKAKPNGGGTVVVGVRRKDYGPLCWKLLIVNNVLGIVCLIAGMWGVAKADEGRWYSALGAMAPVIYAVLVSIAFIPVPQNVQGAVFPRLLNGLSFCLWFFLPAVIHFGFLTDV